ncbi:two-component system response regulator CreB [Loktanella sp. D2R18]|uniref:response regulator transcription factor n=1 Tax=Rhodobacterales TaxID=204455 RepID=UPI000DE98B01|nr:MULTISPECIES: response regulator transcription factor [Rhodobacterales]MDO6591050.1 response regulator transcription factor [Yoonia sp. 1_MG-2023]RBW42198.1 two-component system response regulator CreB [Loktanella sp. D2R18]
MILIADDDAQIRDVLRIALGQAGFAVAEAADGRAALEAARSLKPDLIVLDIGMPEMDGLSVCRELRKDSQVPVLFLTAQADEIDRVVGLELGADDYVSKPFSPRELVARVRAIVKRSGVSAPEQAVMRRGLLSLDPERHLCHVNDAPVTLTAREMELALHLMRRPDNVLSRPQLVDQIYGTNVHVSDRTMDSHLRNLRAKLTAAGCADAIETVHGVGIRMGACRGG